MALFRRKAQFAGLLQYRLWGRALAFLPFVLAIRGVSAAEPGKIDSDTAAGAPPPCQWSLPLSATLTGFFAAQIECKTGISWGVRLGTALLGFRQPVEYVRTKASVAYPPEGLQGRPAGLASWQVVHSVKYAYLPEGTATRIKTSGAELALASPALQQWNALMDSDLSLELRYWGETADKAPRFGLRAWQTLPARWRTLGGLHETRNADARGLQALYFFTKNPWAAELGLGRMTVEVDRISATSLYPTFEITLELGTP